MSYFLTFLIAAVWLVNGFVCKVLGFVPRHQEIVGRILGESYADVLTLMIGLAECVMAVWVLSKFKPRLCAAVQIVVVLTMNVIEFFLVPDLLLFGRLNFVIALLFVAVVFYNALLIERQTD